MSLAVPSARAAVRAFTRQPGRRCCPASASRRGTRPPRLLLPGERLRAGPARAEECQSGLSTRVASESGLQRRWPLPGKTPWAASTSARPTSAGIVQSINQRGGIDLDALDAVAPSHNSLWAASQTAWAAGDPAP